MDSKTNSAAADRCTAEFRANLRRLWVRLGPSTTSGQRPDCPRKRTFGLRVHEYMQPPAKQKALLPPEALSRGVTLSDRVGAWLEPVTRVARSRRGRAPPCYRSLCGSAT